MSRDIRELSKWIEDHPRQAWVYTIGLAVMIFEVAAILDQLLKRVQ